MCYNLLHVLQPTPTGSGVDKTKALHDLTSSHKGCDILAEVWIGAFCSEQMKVLCLKVWAL